ncbi:hypothetical protein HHI36_008134 [Cryptolaemus montrouzieri]|uniref:Uncharacterized protein n=1 Tax=Cryptolaemus montrouzieri TaxID=559131 RepID=A0ABD2MSH6_9CUCU
MSKEIDSIASNDQNTSRKEKKTVRVRMESVSEQKIPDHPGPYSITEEELQKRLETNASTGRKITQIYSCFVVSMGHLTFGTCLGWASPMMFQEAETRSQEQATDNIDDFASFYTWMTALVPLGACFGFGVWTVTGYKNGPRKTLLVQTVIYLVLWIFLLFMGARKLMQASRFFLGFFGIAYIVCGQMLMNDTIVIALLKYLRIVPQIAVLMGVFLVQLTGIFTQSHNGAMTCMGITVVTFFLLFIMPESPVHMYQRGEKHAEDSLSWYVGRKNISDSMRRIRRDYEYRRMNVEDKYMLNSSVVKKEYLLLLEL